MRKRLLIILLAFVSVLSLMVGITACSYKTDYGKSAYDLYKELYIQEHGSEDGLLTLSDWLLSLKGETGEQGNQGVQGEQGEQGETGEEGKSAYELYVEAYIKETGSDNGVLLESEWRESLHGATGISIYRVEIVCGDIIIYYDNDTLDTLENMLPEAGHNWDEGVTSTSPTCITPGVITYACNDCGATKKELTDANGEHSWGEYAYDDEYHWRICKICGEIEKHEHEFGDVSKDSNVDALIECVCGIHKTVGDFYSFKVTFECDDGVSVMAYETQNYANGGYISKIAYARDSDTGALLNDGDGQVNFEVILELGYKLKSVSISPKSYKNLKDPSEINRENTYRITKITGELIVSIETEIDFLELPVMVINTENSMSILDKENYINCKISVQNAEDIYCFESAGAGIRGRGNTTWTLPKKPYKIKFDNKINLFGNGEAKKWTLIANYSDPSLIRNYLAYTLGSEFEGIKETTTSVQFVELFLNGQYEGVYLVCEQNEAGETRVDIDEDVQEANGSIKINTGYLLETDNAYYEGVEDQDYFIVEGKYFQIKSPDTEEKYFLENKDEFITFIKTKIQEAYYILRLDNSNNNYEKVKEIIDVESFLDGYIIDELLNIVDGEFSSFYIFYDNKDGKIHRGPIWDYDASMGNCAYSPGACSPNALCADHISWYRLLLNFEEFQEALRGRLEDFCLEDKFSNYLLEQNNIINSYSSSFERNFIRWNILGQNRPELAHWNTVEIAGINTWVDQVEYVFNWLKESFNYIKSVYCS